MLRLALLGIVATACPALAAEAPDLAFVGVHQGELTAADQEALAAEVVVGVADSGKARALVPAQVAGTIKGREKLVIDDGLAGPARQKLASGIELYNQAQWEAATALLSEAVDQLELTFPGRIDVEDLWTAWVYLGTARLQSGADGVDEAMAAAATLASYRRPDEALFPPDAVAAYDAAVEWLKLHPTTLTIKGSSEGEAFIDGQSAGPVPVVVDGLGPGTHYVVVRGPDGRSGFAAVTLEPGSVATPEPEPEPEVAPEGEAEGEPEGETATPIAPEPAPPRAETVTVQVGEPSLGRPAASRLRREEQIGALYRALGTRAAGVELVLLGGDADEVLQLQLYDVARDEFSRALEVPYEGKVSEEVVASLPLLMNLVDREGQLTATAPRAVGFEVGTNAALASLLLDPPEPMPIEDRSGGGKKRSVVPWIVAAGVVALAAGGGAAYAISQQGGSEPTGPTGTDTDTGTPITGPQDGGAITFTF
jgi:hypothetical protein